MEWAAGEVLADLRGLFDQFGVRATFFVTHAGVETPGHERGLHPNFRRNGDTYRLLCERSGGGTMLGDDEVYEHIMQTTLAFAPEAKGLRTHSLYYDFTLLPLYNRLGLEYDCSYQMPFVAELRPFWKQHEILEIPTFYADHLDIMTGATGFGVAALGLDRPGLKVFDFHPNIVFLNASSNVAICPRRAFIMITSASRRARIGQGRAYAPARSARDSCETPIADRHRRRSQCGVARGRQMDLKAAEDSVTAVPLGADERPWQDFLAHSVNGTLFHDLEFLRYQPQGRFRFHHVMLMRRGRPVALVPGGLERSHDRQHFCSPLGASVGGLVVAPNLSANMAMSMIEALQNYARHQGWNGIQVTLPPSYYSFETAGLIGFALFCAGFRLEHRWLCHVLRARPRPRRLSASI